MNIIVLIKIIIPILLIILTVVQIIRDWKYDKRTRRYHQVTRALLYVYIILILPLAIILYNDSRESSNEKLSSKRAQEKIDDIAVGKDKLLSDISQYRQQVSEMQDKIDDLVTGKNDLLTKNSELLTQIGKYQYDLQAKEKQIGQLEEKAKMANRGISSSYDFNGAKRETAGAQCNVTAGEECNVFLKMVDLEQNKRYLELITLCKKQIQTTPDWLTPYYYLGIAYANSGDKSKAIDNFEHVVHNAPGDPNYAQAKEFLKQLRNQ